LGLLGYVGLFRFETEEEWPRPSGTSDQACDLRKVLVTSTSVFVAFRFHLHLKGEVSQKTLYTAVVVVNGGLAYGLFPGSAPSWLTVPAHKTKVIAEVVTTFSSFQVS
jgi:hypothetical protein